MNRVDTSRPVRAVVAVGFAYDSVAIIEALAAERAGRTPRFPTISAEAWRHPSTVPVILGLLAAHLVFKPNPPSKGATL